MEVGLLGAFANDDLSLLVGGRFEEAEDGELTLVAFGGHFRFYGRIAGSPIEDGSGYIRGCQSIRRLTSSAPPLLRSRVGEDLVPLDGDTAALPVLEQIAEPARHLFVERRLSRFRILVRVEERDRQHLAVRRNQFEVTLVAGQSLHQWGDDRHRLTHRPLRYFDIDPLETCDASDHGSSFRRTNVSWLQV
jgi:hypothetical protein